MNVAPRRNYVTIYKDDSRDEFLRATRDEGPIFDRVTRTWIVTNPDLGRELMVSPKLIPMPAQAMNVEMAPDVQIKLESLIYAGKHIPLCHTGESHAALRRRLSEHLASRRAPMAAWIAEKLDDYLVPFTRPGRFDAAEEVFSPIVIGMMEQLAGIRMSSEVDIGHTSQVFDKFASMSRRVEVAGLMTELHRHVRRELGPEAGEDEVGLRLGLIVIGHDSTVGAFSESMLRLLQAADGRPLSEIEYPKSFSQTGVPFIERVVVEPFSLGGADFEKDALVRIVTQTYTLSPPEEHHRMFGAGIHSCVGRPASVDLWGAVTARLKQMSTRVRVLAYDLTPNNYIFNVPRQFEVEVTT